MKNVKRILKPGHFLIPVIFALLITFWAGSCQKNIKPEPAAETPTPPGVAGLQVSNRPILVELTEKQVADLGIRVVTAQKSPFHYMVSAPGIVQGAPGHISIVSAPVNGRVVRIYAHEGEKVKQGDLLLELESLEFANIGADYLQAYAEARFQEQQMKRLKVLVEKKISPQRTLEKTEMDYTRALAAERAALARLNALGVQQSQIDKWRTGIEEKPVLRFYSPISGVIDEHLIELGQSVNAYEKMLSIINTGKVLVRGFVPPDDATYLKPGDSLRILPKKARDINIEAAISTINPALDPKNKSKVINVIVRTQNNWPIPGQNVQLEITASMPVPIMAIPLSAVEYEGTNPTVFIQKSPVQYEKRNIRIGRVTNNMAVVDSGLVENEKVAVNQVFALKALSRFEEFSD